MTIGHIIFGALVAAGIALLAANVLATICVGRTAALGRSQKLAQLAFIWGLPFVGAMLVMRLLSESDPDVVYRQWIPNETINAYVLQLLTVEARISLHAAQSAIEHSIVDPTPSVGSEDSGVGDSPGGAGSGD